VDIAVVVNQRDDFTAGDAMRRAQQTLAGVDLARLLNGALPKAARAPPRGPQFSALQLFGTAFLESPSLRPPRCSSAARTHRLCHRGRGLAGARRLGVERGNVVCLGLGGVLIACDLAELSRQYSDHVAAAARLSMPPPAFIPPSDVPAPADPTWAARTRALIASLANYGWHLDLPQRPS
jgi:hypothetical protein